jgi:hypothetical protein
MWIFCEDAPRSGMPEEPWAVLNEWFSSEAEYELLYFWENNGTFYVVCEKASRLYFLRLFKIQKTWNVSQDWLCFINTP